MGAKDSEIYENNKICIQILRILAEEHLLTPQEELRAIELLRKGGCPYGETSGGQL